MTPDEMCFSWSLNVKNFRHTTHVTVTCVIKQEIVCIKIDEKQRSMINLYNRSTCWVYISAGPSSGSILSNTSALFVVTPRLPDQTILGALKSFSVTQLAGLLQILVFGWKINNTSLTKKWWYHVRALVSDGNTMVLNYYHVHALYFQRILWYHYNRSKSQELFCWWLVLSKPECIHSFVMVFV